MSTFNTGNDRTEALRDSETRARASIAKGEPLEALNDLLSAIELHAGDEMMAQVMLLDDDGARLTKGAAPSLPIGYDDAVDGLAVSASNGSVGASVFYGEPVIASDIAVDPLWADMRDLALSHGLKACWSTPIRSSDGRIMGAFASYSRKPGSPALGQLEAIASTLDTVALAVDAHALKLRRKT